VLGADVAVLEPGRLFMSQDHDLAGSLCEPLEQGLRIPPPARAGKEPPPTAGAGVAGAASALPGWSASGGQPDGRSAPADQPRLQSPLSYLNEIPRRTR
jgi:hypothetical protein